MWVQQQALKQELKIVVFFPRIITWSVNHYEHNFIQSIASCFSVTHVT